MDSFCWLSVDVELLAITGSISDFLLSAIASATYKYIYKLLKIIMATYVLLNLPCRVASCERFPAAEGIKIQLSLTFHRITAEAMAHSSCPIGNNWITNNNLKESAIFTYQERHKGCQHGSKTSKCGHDANTSTAYNLKWDFKRLLENFCR